MRPSCWQDLSDHVWARAEGQRGKLVELMKTSFVIDRHGYQSMPDRSPGNDWYAGLTIGWMLTLAHELCSPPLSLSIYLSTFSSLDHALSLSHRLSFRLTLPHSAFHCLSLPSLSFPNSLFLSLSQSPSHFTFSDYLSPLFHSLSLSLPLSSSIPSLPLFTLFFPV